MASHTGRRVFAHYMVGLTYTQTPEQWARDMACAKEAGIDGFALNIGPSDLWTDTQLHHAYTESERAGDFSLFISFDMAAGSWSVSQVVNLINRHKDTAAQAKVGGRPLVSTFEGPDWANNWSHVREQTGDIFLVPDWSSLGPHGVGQRLKLIDGAFSWDAWPKAGQSRMSMTEDILYKDALRGKAYMMGWNKQWHCSSESLWYDRWKQVLEIMPDFVQIISWNDFGESSYICDTSPEQLVPGSERYVLGHSHSAFRAVLPYLIAAYKSGSSQVTWPTQGTAIAWYRTMPACATKHNGVVWGQGGTVAAAHGTRDVVSVMSVARGPASIVVEIGDSARMTFETRGESPLTYFEVPFDSSATGPVSLSVNLRRVTGPAIMASDCGDGEASFNCVAIQV